MRPGTHRSPRDRQESKAVAGKRLKGATVTGGDVDGAVDADAGVAPGKEEPCAVLVEDDLRAGAGGSPSAGAAARCRGAYVGGRPGAETSPAAAGDHGVDVGMEVELASEGLDNGNHPGAGRLVIRGGGQSLADGLPGGDV